MGQKWDKCRRYKYFYLKFSKKENNNQDFFY